MKIGVYPGSFDPVTLGHLDIITRGAKIVDKLIVGVLNNNSKTPMFTVEQRIEMLEKVTAHLPNVEIAPFAGLLVDFMKKNNATLVIRGLRAVSDFEYELQLAQTNKSLDKDIETIFLVTNVKYSFVSSTLVKEISHYKGDISQFVPPEVLEYIEKIKIE